MGRGDPLHPIAAVRLPVAALALALALAPPSGAAAQSHRPAECLPAALSAAGALHDQAGRGIAAGQFAGRLAVITLLQRDCDATCAMRIIDLGRIARALPPTLAGRVAMIAIDTGGRSVAGLRRLGRTWRLDARRWTLVGGSSASTVSARRSFDVTLTGEAEPSAVVAVFDANGSLRQRYTGAPLDRDRLSREIAVIDALPRPSSPAGCDVSAPLSTRH